MSKLPVVSSNDLIKYLVNEKGFSYVHTRGDHHIFKSETRRVSIPERKEIGKGLLLGILAEAEISKEEFMEYYTG